jgi:hypothetical protein
MGMNVNEVFSIAAKDLFHKCSKDKEEKKEIIEKQMSPRQHQQVEKDVEETKEVAP